MIDEVSVLTDKEASKSFLVNTGGFPLNEATWNKMYYFCQHNFPGYANEILGLSKQSYFGVHITNQPKMESLNKISPVEKLVRVQAYMSSLQYNYTGTQFYVIPKHRPIVRLEQIAKEMIKNSLPIKCLEAVILATYLTQGHVELKRFPVSFKTIVNGNKYRHVVLAVCWRGFFGALGMSRRHDLMFKPLSFCSLSSLIQSYIAGYRGYGHTILKVKVGSIISHHPHILEKIPWDCISISPNRADECKWRSVVDEYSKMLNFTILPQVRAAAVAIGRKDSQNHAVGFSSGECRKFSDIVRNSRENSKSSNLRTAISSNNTHLPQKIPGLRQYRKSKKISAVLPFHSLSNKTVERS